MPSRYYRRGAGATAALLGVSAILATAVLTRFLTKRAEDNHIAGGRLLRLDGQTIHFIDEGSGPCVILLHGNGSMIEDFQATTLIETLAKDHRVIAVDRPGFGLSSREAGGAWTPEREADHLLKVFAHLEVHEAVIVGHSWGTLVALAIALRNRAFVSGLVLLSGYYYPTLRLDVALQTPASLPVVGPLLRHTILPLIARLDAPRAIRHMFAPMNVSLLFSRLFSVPMASRPSQLKSIADDTLAMPSSAARLSQGYAELDTKVRIIAGASDKIVSTPEQSGRLSREIQNSRLRILEGVGHMTHHARPDLVAKAVRELTAPVGGDMPETDFPAAHRRVS